MSWNKLHHIVDLYNFNYRPLGPQKTKVCFIFSQALTCLCISSTCLWGILFRMLYISNNFSSGMNTDALWRRTIQLFNWKQQTYLISKCWSGRPFPVKYFIKWENVGVSEDHRDTSCLQHITEGSLAKTGPAQHHTEWGLLSGHIKKNLLTKQVLILIYWNFGTFYNISQDTCKIWG